MKTLNQAPNAYTTKWIVFTSLIDSGFKHKYQRLFESVGLMSIGKNNSIYAIHFNSLNEKSINRKNEITLKISKKINQYKKRQALLAFTITDKQFGMIGKNINWSGLNVPTSIGNLPVTREQMYESGCIAIKGSQARYNHPNLIN